MVSAFAMPISTTSSLPLVTAVKMRFRLQEHVVLGKDGHDHGAVHGSLGFGHMTNTKE